MSPTMVLVLIVGGVVVGAVLGGGLFIYICVGPFTRFVDAVIAERLK